MNATRTPAVDRVRSAEDALHASPVIRVIPTLFGGAGRDELAVTVPVPALRRLRLREPSPTGHRVIRVPTEDAGDERFSWDPTDFAQIAEAKRFFNQMIAKGLVPYYVDPGTKRNGMEMVEFDPTAEEVIFSPINVPRAVTGG